MNGIARIHHWVPQCYLKGFARSPSKKAQLFVFDRNTQRTFVSHPSGIAGERDFNRISAEGYAPNYMEDQYALFESDLALVLRRMWKDRIPVAGEDLNLLLNLISLLAARNPRMRENVRDFSERVIKQMMHLSVATEDRYEATFGRAVKDGHVAPNPEVDYQSMKEFIDGEQYKITMATTRHVENELHMHESILGLLGHRQWCLLRAAPGSGGFITSDHPTCLIWTQQRDRGFFSSPGVGLKGTEVVFPVSYDLAIIGLFERIPDVRDVGPDIVAHVNGVVAHHSDRQVYARDDKFVFMLPDGRVARGADLLRHLPKREKTDGR